VLGFV